MGYKFASNSLGDRRRTSSVNKGPCGWAISDEDDIVVARSIILGKMSFGDPDDNVLRREK